MIRSWTMCAVSAVVCLTLGAQIGCRRGKPTAQPQPGQSKDAQASQPLQTPATDSAKEPPATPLDAMQRMVKAYASAPSYSDEAVVTLSYSQNGETLTDAAPLQVSMNRAENLLRVRAYQVDFVCREGRLRAKVNDPATNDLDHQALDLPVSDPVTLDALNADPVLADLLNRGMARSPIQLELLYGAAQLDFFLNDNISKEWVPEETIAGQPCYGVAIGSPTEQFVFWIDKQNFLLRRLDYPTNQLSAASSATGMRLTAEFHNASFDADQAQFQWSPPATAKFVRYFVPPPQTLPTALYGKPVNDFQFQRLNGDALTNKQLASKPAVLVWFSQDLTCRNTLQQVSQVREVWDENDVGMYAVCTEGKDFTNDQVESLRRQWRVSLPVVRDLDAFGRDVFAVSGLPTLVVLDSRGRLQVFDVGFNPNLAQELDLVLRLLKEGKNVSAQVLQRAQNERATYLQDLVAAGAEGVEVKFPVAERSSPTKLSLQRKWTVTAIKQPGNVTCFEDNGESQILVMDGLRTITMLDEEGEVRSSRELDLPPNHGVTMLRTAVVDDARWFLAATPGGDQVSLFDSTWKRVQLYPTDPLHDGILDATLIPASYGVEMLIGYRGAGLHGIDAKGARRWSVRDVDSPVSLDIAETGEGWRAVATDPAGQLYVFTPDGQSLGKPVRAGGWPLYEIATSRFPHQDGGVLCGISYDALGQRIAVGLDLTLTQQWRHQLPGGSFDSPVRAIASGTLMDQGFWLLAAPDGSLHLLSADGAIQDQWNYGKLVRGIAISGRQQLIVTTADGVDCWSVASQ